MMAINGEIDSAAGTVFDGNFLRGDRSLRSLSGNKEMSFHHWSRHELMHAEHTDHWSKLRCKSYRLTKLPTGNMISFCRPEASWVQQYARQKLGLPKATMVTPKGTLAPVGSPEFNKYLKDRLHNPYLVQPRPPQDSRGYDKIDRTPSAYNQRAKSGWRYWLEDRNKPTSPGKKYTMGSKGTHLGIGVPRL